MHGNLALARHMWNVHHSGDVSTVAPFYGEVFGWTFSPEGGGVFSIQDASGAVIAHAEEARDAMRGTYRYWMPIFGVRLVTDSVARVEAPGGSCVSQLSPDRATLSDDQGAALMLQDV